MLYPLYIFIGACWVSAAPHPALKHKGCVLEEPQPLPTRGADPKPCCHAGASRQQPNLSFIVLFCSTSIFDFPFTSDFSISSLLSSPNVPCSDSSWQIHHRKSLKSSCSAGGLPPRALKLNTIWGCFLLQFGLLLHSEMFSALSGSSATWKCL